MNRKKKSKREQLRAQRKRKQWIKRLGWGAAILLVVGGIGMLLTNGGRSPLGDAVPVQAAVHVPPDQQPSSYNTDPPTSGPHYASEMNAGFYPPEALESGPPYPEGYLVHNLEHGYVIFWYNCDELEGQSCDELTAAIQGVMEKVNNFKVIAYPRATLEVPVVMTSWGRIMRMPTFDTDQALAFVKANRNRAPEPNAP